MLIHIELDSDKPIYMQIHDQIVEGIASNELYPGYSLPSIRQLAADFGINLHTVNKAYNLLEQEGFIILKRKTGAVIHITPALPDDWQARQRTLIAEAIAKGKNSAEILDYTQHILDDFYKQRESNQNKQ